MKKYLSIIALATLALVGCSKVTPDNTVATQLAEEDVPITYAAYNYLSQTKADGDNQGHLIFEAGPFDVWARYFEGDTYSPSSAVAYFSGVKVTHQGTDPNKVWKADPTVGTYYWPKTGKLAFHAVYPSGLIDGTTNKLLSDGTFTITKTVTAAASSQSSVKDEDLMLAENTTGLSANTNPGTHYTPGVGLIFKHQLAKLMFEGRIYKDGKYDSTSKKIKEGSVYFSATIDEISISGIKNVGTLYWNTTLTTPAYDWKDQTGSVASGAIVTMGNPEDASTHVFDYDEALPAENYMTFKNSSNKTIEYYVLPQELTNSAVITVKYTVYGINSADNKVISKTVYDGTAGNHNAFTTKLNTIKGKKHNTEETSAEMTDWNINTVYDYKFVIDPFEEQIYFDPCIVDWDRMDADPTVIHPDTDGGTVANS